MNEWWSLDNKEFSIFLPKAQFTTLNSGFWLLMFHFHGVSLKLTGLLVGGFFLTSSTKFCHKSIIKSDNHSIFRVIDIRRKNSHVIKGLCKAFGGKQAALTT